MPLTDSDRQKLKELGDHFYDTYLRVKEELGDKFEPLMADLAAEILELRYKAKEGTTFVEVAMLMSMTSREEYEQMNSEEREQADRLNRMVKACIGWYALEFESLK
jgi:hypothetical protein